ncbi:MAG: protease modulator HflC [Proteobacteria bacterium]|jgi:membrane protease subunit HflC|nr:protease modulator HflC [Pseudomonadota bacterium]
MNPKQILIPLVLVLVIGAGLASMFTVNERELAIKFRLGEIVNADYKPGLHFKLPLVNNVRFFDSRILTLDARPTEYLTAEKKKVVVDFFAKWRINDVEKYYRTMSGGDQRTAAMRLYNIINDGLKTEFSRRTVHEVVSGDYPEDEEQPKAAVKPGPKIDARTEIMANMTKLANSQVEKFGILIVDVRIKRIDFPPEISKDVFRRMESERARIAAEIRAQGAEKGETIRANADRERTVLLAESHRKGLEIRGAGDGAAAEIYARAYSQDPEFYSFYRSLDAYRTAFQTGADVLVLEPDSEFFKYFNQAKPARK